MDATFVTSATSAAGFPRDGRSELALAGRSNVGKSTLINALVHRRIARTSAAPGKTRLANFYLVAPDGVPPFYLVDLPGYGYARGGEAAAREFEVLTSEYFGDRTQRPRAGAVRGGDTRGAQLAGVLLLVDSRHPGLDADRRAWTWLRQLPVPCRVVATKVDKLTRTERVRNLNALERLHEGPVVAMSAQTGEGLKELWKTIDALLRQPLRAPEARTL